MKKIVFSILVGIIVSVIAGSIMIIYGRKVNPYEMSIICIISGGVAGYIAVFLKGKNNKDK